MRLKKNTIINQKVSSEIAETLENTAFLVTKQERNMTTQSFI